MSSNHHPPPGSPTGAPGVPKPSVPCAAEHSSSGPVSRPTGPAPLPFPIRGSTVECHADDGMEATADVAPPLHPSTTFVQSSPHNSPQLVYSRMDSVTRQRVEAVLGRLDGGAAVTYASGLAAATALIGAVRPRRLYSEAGYHGVKAALGYWKERAEAVGGQVEFISEAELQRIAQQPDADFQPLPPSAWSTAATTATPAADRRVLDLIWLESPNNPYATVADIGYFAAIARKTGALLAIDATLSSPLGQQPLSHGCDVVLHATTKYLGGHSDLLGGALVCKAAAMAEGLARQRVIDGAVMGSLECWLLLRSLRTLSLRVKQQTATTTQLLGFLTRQRLITAVHHPSLPSHPSYAAAARYLLLPPACFAIELPDERQAKQLVAGLRLWKDATSLGSVESLIDWRYQYDKSVSQARQLVAGLRLWKEGGLLLRSLRTELRGCGACAGCDGAVRERLTAASSQRPHSALLAMWGVSEQSERRDDIQNKHSCQTGMRDVGLHGNHASSASNAKLRGVSCKQEHTATACPSYCDDDIAHSVRVTQLTFDYHTTARGQHVDTKQKLLPHRTVNPRSPHLHPHIDSLGE